MTAGSLSNRAAHAVSGLPRPAYFVRGSCVASIKRPAVDPAVG